MKGDSGPSVISVVMVALLPPVPLIGKYHRRSYTTPLLAHATQGRGKVTNAAPRSKHLHGRAWAAIDLCRALSGWSAELRILQNEKRRRAETWGSDKAEDSSVRSAPLEKPPPARIPLSARLFCDQYTRPLRCYRGTRCGLFDEMSDGLRLRHIHGVAAFDLDDR